MIHDMKKVDILGTCYTIEIKKYEDEPSFKNQGICGYCDGRLKKIVCCDISTCPNFENESEEYIIECEKGTLRHEIIHAFFDESGLMENSIRFSDAWSQNEEMTDWFAIQSPKIFKVYQELDII